VRALFLSIAALFVLPTPSFSQSTALPSASGEKYSYEDRHPEGLFSRIVTAHGHELVMGNARSFQIIPVRPSETFSADVPEIFVVFQLQQHESEFKVYGRWVVEKGEGVPANHLLGTDAMLLMTEDESGYLSLKRPPAGWPVGDYKVKIFTGTGASDMDPIGTLRFKVLPAKAAS
jgi:hypothetical protein